MVRIYVENLSPEIKKGMKEWKYSAEELELIYARIMTRRAELMKGFKRAAIIMGAVRKGGSSLQRLCPRMLA